MLSHELAGRVARAVGRLSPHPRAPSPRPRFRLGSSSAARSSLTVESTLALYAGGTFSLLLIAASGSASSPSSPRAAGSLLPQMAVRGTLVLTAAGLIGTAAWQRAGVIIARVNPTPPDPICTGGCIAIGCPATNPPTGCEAREVEVAVASAIFRSSTSWRTR